MRNPNSVWCFETDSTKYLFYKLEKSLETRRAMLIIFGERSRRVGNEAHQ